MDRENRNGAHAHAGTSHRKREDSRVGESVERERHNHLGAPGKMFPDEVRDLSLPQHRQMAWWWDVTIMAFKVLMGIGLVLGLAFFLRPSISNVEKRTLTSFPSFTWETFLDGTYTKDISTWYSDTYPFRDQLIAADHVMENFFGIESNEQLIGNHAKGDEIPTEGQQTVAPADTKPEAKLPEEYSSSDLEADIQGEIMNSAYVKDGACYTNYYFTQSAASAYARAVNKAAEDLGDDGQVYSILIPNNSAVLLSPSELAALGGSNEQQAIEYYYSLYDDSVISVPTFDTLREHNSEYLYFRTDHHWTALGAYYVYRSFCAAKGIEPHEMAQFQEEDFPNFVGSYYDTLQLASMANNPDTVQAWVPMGTNDMAYTDADGNTMQWNVIEDVSGWSDSSKYSCFVAGDQTWAQIHNPALDDGSSCVVVKESYGNAFIPWLVDHYEDVYIADFRYVNVNVVDFMKSNGVHDLILINNITIIGSEQVAGKIESLM